MTYMSPKPIVPDTTLVPANEGLIQRQRQQAGTFTPLERAVIDLSLGDTIASLRKLPSQLRPIHDFLFGARPTMLADPRLEALRRFCVLQRHLHTVSAEEHQRFLEAGYSESHAQRLAAILQARRRHRFSKTVPLLGGVLVLLAVFGVYRAALHTLDEALPALILAGVAFVTLLSLATSGARRRP